MGTDRAADRPKAPSPLLGLTLGALAVLPYLVWDLPWRSYAGSSDAIDGVLESTGLSLAVGGAAGLIARRLTSELARTMALLFVPFLLGALELAPAFHSIIDAIPDAPAWLVPAAPVVAASIAVLGIARFLRGWPVPLALALGLRAALPLVPIGEAVGCRVIAMTVIGATLLALLRLHTAWARPSRAPAFGLFEDLAALALVLAVGGSACFARASIAPLPRTPVDDGLRAVILRGLDELSDVDGDGYGVLLGTRDCDPFDPMVHPAQHEWADNQRDDNCLAGDAVDHADWLRRRTALHDPPPAFTGDIVMVALEAPASEAGSSPEFEALTAQAVSFDRAYATALDAGQFLAGVLTSRLAPAVPGSRAVPRDPYPIAPPTTLFEALREHGYDVGVVGDLPVPELFTAGARLVEPARGATAEVLASQAVATLRRLSTAGPRMLYVHFPRGQAGASMGRILGELQRAIGARAALVVLAYPRDDARAAAVVEAAHVPLLVLAPALPARRVHAVTSYLSILPTLLAMVAPESAPVGPGPYLCLTAHACRDADAPVAVEGPTRHLHALVAGTTHIVRDVQEGRTTVFDRAATGMRAPTEAERNVLSLWEERGLTEDPGRFWPY